MSNSTPERGGELSGPKAAAWYQVTLAAIGDAVLTTDPDGLVTYMNPVAESLTGWSAAEALGKRLEDVFHIVNEETRKPIEQPVRKVIDTGLVRGLANHTLLIARDGSELPIDDSAAPVWGEDGKLVGVVMIFRDITERRRASTSSSRPGDSPRASSTRCENRCSSLTRTSTSGRRTAPSTRPSGSSPPRPKAGSSTTSATASGTSRHSGRCWRKSSPETARLTISRWSTISRPSAAKTMLLNARRFPPEGKWELILLAIADITERKRLELEREGLLKSAEEARDRAEAAAAKLADADRQKNQFLAMLAHELRNPLAAVRNAVEVASRSGSKEDLEWSRDVTARQVGNFAHLINDLLDVARITEGKIQLRKELIDAAPVIRHAIEAVKPIVEERKHELLALVHVDRPEARGRLDPA